MVAPSAGAKRRFSAPNPTPTPVSAEPRTADAKHGVEAAPPHAPGSTAAAPISGDAQRFLLGHRAMLARMAVDPDWSHRPITARGAVSVLAPCAVFSFYNTLVQPSPPAAPDCAEGEHVLRWAVTQERCRLKDTKHLKATHALEANLRRVETQLHERETAWARSHSLLAARTRLLSIAASDQPLCVKVAGMLAIATARPETVLSERTFRVFHEMLLLALAEDPAWRTAEASAWAGDADESARHSAPEPDAVFRFYQRLRGALALPADPGALKDCDAIAAALDTQAYFLYLRGVCGGKAMADQFRSLAKAFRRAVNAAILRF